MKTRYLFTYIVLFTIIGISCKRKCYEPSNPVCVNYNPCYNSTPFKAGFKIYELIGSIKVETDTVGEVSNVLFEADGDYDSYTWLIGDEVIQSKSFVRRFFPLNVKVEVTLIAKKEVNKFCQPFDDGIDTITKSLRAVAWDPNITPILGTFRGVNTDAPLDTFEITTYRESTLRPGTFSAAMIGIPKGNTTVCAGMGLDIGASGYDIYANNIYPCYFFTGKAIVENNKLIFEYKYKPNKKREEPDTKKVFIGTKKR